MAKSKLVLKMKLKVWAKPVVFALCFVGLRSWIGRWMLDIKVGSE